MTWLPGRVLLADEETVEAIACAIDPRYRALVLLLRYGRRHPPSRTWPSSAPRSGLSPMGPGCRPPPRRGTGRARGP
jgi:hypothetical protein